MKKSFLTCGGMLIVFIIIAIVGIVLGVRALDDALQESLLQELGFSNEAEYNDFVDIMNRPFDETPFYQDTYSESDIEYVTNQLNTNIELQDGSTLFYENGYINIGALDIENNTTILNPMQFTSKQYAYFNSLLFQSLFADANTEQNELIDISVLNFSLISQTSHNILFSLNTAQLKQELGNFGEALPNRLYINLNYDIITLSDGSYQTTNESIHFNALDETYNNKCINFFRGVLQAHPASVFADIFIALVNSFDNSTHTKTIFNESTITVGGIQ